MYQQKTREKNSFRINRNQVKLKPYVLKIDFNFEISSVNFKVKLVNSKN